MSSNRPLTKPGEDVAQVPLQRVARRAGGTSGSSISARMRLTRWRCPPEEDAAGVGPEQPIHQALERGLATAARAEEDSGASFGDMQVQRVQGLGAAESLGHLFEHEHAAPSSTHARAGPPLIPRPAPGWYLRVTTREVLSST